jgi:hypothetical protein
VIAKPAMPPLPHRPRWTVATAIEADFRTRNNLGLSAYHRCAIDVRNCRGIAGVRTDKPFDQIPRLLSVHRTLGGLDSDTV